MKQPPQGLLRREVHCEERRAPAVKVRLGAHGLRGKHERVLRFPGDGGDGAAR